MAASRSPLYRIKIVDRDDTRGLVKVHFVGYKRTEDEWTRLDELVMLNDGDNDNRLPSHRVDAGSNEHDDEVQTSNPSTSSIKRVLPFDFNRELALRIKSRLRSSRTDNPQVSIELPFDELVFKGGLGQAATIDRRYRGNIQYKITKYSNLDLLLGNNWHVRGLNDKGDFSYVICDSVRFYLKQLKPIIDYERHDDEFVKVTHISGKSLVFSFVRGDGNRASYDTYYQ